MGPTVRLRFVALDLPDGWIELSRVGVWKLGHPDRRGTLSISMFPVAEGVTMDLPTLGALSRKRWENDDLLDGRMREHLKKARESMPEQPETRRHMPPPARTLLLGETSWLEGSLFCVARQMREDMTARLWASFGLSAEADPTSFRAEWTVSDGAYVLEATLRDPEESHFLLGATEWDNVMRSLRFEGPS
jgi:hypothetical protein